jgi:pimeloyl-ACP methyl ester carboxylesterase
VPRSRRDNAARPGLLATLSFAALLALPACGDDIPPTTGTVSDEPLHSELVDADYVLKIRLPPGHGDDPARRYPLIIQLDPTFAGLHQFEITSGLVSQHAADGDWPEAIVVGIDDAGDNQRLRDYVLPAPPDPEYAGANADRFYAAIRDEFLPHIETHYQVDPARRILVGHSAGATFAWYAAFRHAPPEPPLFHGVLAADVGLDEAVFTYERWHAERSDTLPLTLYSASAAFNGAVEKITLDAMAQRLDDRAYDDFEFERETFETDHGGVIVPAFEHGLDLLLGGG